MNELNTVAAIIVVFIAGTVFGFQLGYEFCKWRSLKICEEVVDRFLNKIGVGK